MADNRITRAVNGGIIFDSKYNELVEALIRTLVPRGTDGNPIDGSSIDTTSLVAVANAHLGTELYPWAYVFCKALELDGLTLRKKVAADNSVSTITGDVGDLLILDSNFNTIANLSNIPTGSGSGVSTFLGLTGTPSAWGSTAGQILRLNSARDALEWVNAPTFLNIAGTPGAWGTVGQYLRVNSARNSLEWVNAPTFLNITGTPNSFGTAEQILQVNSARNGLEWVDKPAGSAGVSTFLGLTGTPGSWGSAGEYLKVNSATDAIEWTPAPTVLNIGGTPDSFDGAHKVLKTNTFNNQLGWADYNLISLRDTPFSYGTPEQILQVNSARNGLEWVDKPAGGESSEPSSTGEDRKRFAIYQISERYSQTGSNGRLLSGSAAGNAIITMENLVTNLNTGNNGSYLDLPANGQPQNTRFLSNFDFSETQSTERITSLISGNTSYRTVRYSKLDKLGTGSSAGVGEITIPEGYYKIRINFMIHSDGEPLNGAIMSAVHFLNTDRDQLEGVIRNASGNDEYAFKTFPIFHPSIAGEDDNTPTSISGEQIIFLNASSPKTFKPYLSIYGVTSSDEALYFHNYSIEIERLGASDDYVPFGTGYVTSQAVNTGNFWGRPERFTSDSEIQRVLYHLVGRIQGGCGSDGRVQLPDLNTGSIRYRTDNLGNLTGHQVESICDSTSSPFNNPFATLRISSIIFANQVTGKRERWDYKAGATTPESYIQV